MAAWGNINDNTQVNFLCARAAQGLRSSSFHLGSGIRPITAHNGAEEQTAAVVAELELITLTGCCID